MNTLRHSCAYALAFALTFFSVALLPGEAQGAVAGTGTLSAEWVNGETAGTFHTRTATVSTVRTGVLVQSGVRLTLLPPSGARFVSGQTYTGSSTQSASSALIEPFGFFHCSTLRYSGWVSVDRAIYSDDGTLTQFAARYHADCGSTAGKPAPMDGYVGFGSDVAYSSLRADALREVVPVGESRVREVTVRSEGTASVTLGAASIVGVGRGEYSVVKDNCRGTVIAATETCTVAIRFAPTTAKPEPILARLVLETPGRLSGQFAVALASTAIDLPKQPSWVRTFPTATGLGVAWSGAGTFSGFHLQRRLGPSEAWVDVEIGPDTGRESWVDRDLAPGANAHYRVAGVREGWRGPWAETSGTRPMTVSVPAATSSVAVSDGVTHGYAFSYRSNDPDTEFVVSPRSISARHTVGAVANGADLALPVVPGPGTYRRSFGVSAGLQGTYTVQGACAESELDSVLTVRDVLFAEDLTPRVLDATLQVWCSEGRRVQVDLRVGVSQTPALATTSPGTVRPSTYADKPVAQPVTVTNTSTRSMSLGAAKVLGAAASEWNVVQDTCSHSVVPAGASCSLEAVFATSATGGRLARLELPAGDSTGDLGPIVLPLTGRGATVPGFVHLEIHPFLVGVGYTWTRARDDGGFPVLRYEVARRLPGTAPWTVLASTTDTSHLDRQADDRTYEHAVRAINEVGPGVWHPLRTFPGKAASRGTVVTDETGPGKPRGLVLLGESDMRHAGVPMAGPVEHDHAHPASSPGGTRLVVSRSTNPGSGADGEYDLWTEATLDFFGLQPPTPSRLTSLPGAEMDGAYSPDGTRIAFTHLHRGESSVWVMPDRGGELVQVAGSVGNPAWDADAQSLVVEDRSGPGKPLRRVHLGTGASQALTGTEGATDPTTSAAGVVAYVDRTGRLMELRAGVITPVPAPSTTNRGVHEDPAYASNGDLVATVHDPEDPTRRRVYSVRRGRTLVGASAAQAHPAPAIRDTRAPTVTLGAFAVAHSRGTQAVTFSVADVDPEQGGTPEQALTVECRMGTQAWKPCRQRFDMKAAEDGRHVVQVRATDEAGNVGSASATFDSDSTPPSVIFTRPNAQVILSKRATFTWAGSDAASAVTYDLTWQTSQGGTQTVTRTSTSAARQIRLPVAAGQRLCFSVRARDLRGHVSPAATRCVVRPLDDRTLSASKHWRKAHAATSYGGTHRWAKSRGASLTSTSPVTTRQVGLVVTTGLRHGRVKVYAGTRFLGTLNLRSTRSRTGVVALLPRTSTPITGRVRVVTVSGARVDIDGLVLFPGV